MGFCQLAAGQCLELALFCRADRVKQCRLCKTKNISYSACGGSDAMWRTDKNIGTVTVLPNVSDPRP